MRRPRIPAIPAAAEVAISALLDAILKRLDALEKRPSSPAVVTSDFTAREGQYVRVAAPPLGLNITLPAPNAANRGAEITVSAESTGPIRFQAARGTVNRERVVFSTLLGTIKCVSNGHDNWSVGTGVSSTGSPTGATGPTGPTGPAGARGVQGLPGNDGEPGDMGPPGPAGAAGPLDPIPDQRVLGNDTGAIAKPYPITVHQELDWIASGWNFDGVDDRVNHGNVLARERTQTITLGIWVTTTSGGELISKYDATLPFPPGIRLFMSTTGFSFYEADSVISADLHVTTSGTLTVANGVRHFLVATYSGSATSAGVNLYLDGALQAKTALGASVSNSVLNTAPWLIGGFTSTSVGGQFFAGKLEHAQIYHAELTAAQVLEAYNGGTPPDLNNLATAPKPVLWAKLDGSDTTGSGGIHDYGTGGNNGTAENGLTRGAQQGTIPVRGPAVWEALVPGPTGWVVTSAGLFTKPVYRPVSPTVIVAQGTEVEGPAGDMGPPGPTGATGPAGPPGRPGNDGADGLDGDTGPQGVAGPMGPPGPQGPPGIDGVDGLDGDAGPQGVAGPIGPTGPTGPPGNDGADGVDGVDGLPGTTGATGPTGATGAPGNDGADGQDGQDGPQGIPGPTGPAGPTGPPGNDGVDGQDGQDGPQGLVGATGPMGSPGPPGEASDSFDVSALLAEIGAGVGFTLPDGLRGDVTITAGGTTITINAAAVSNAKLANMAAGTSKGRQVDAGTGVPVNLTGGEQAENWRRTTEQTEDGGGAGLSGTVDITVNDDTTVLRVRTSADTTLRNLITTATNGEGRELIIFHDRLSGSGSLTIPHNTAGTGTPFFNPHTAAITLGQVQQLHVRARFGFWLSQGTAGQIIAAGLAPVIDNTGVLFAIRVAFTAGAAGTADDVTIYAASAPFAFRIIDVTILVSTSIGASTLQLRDTTGGLGSTLSSSLSGATTGTQRNNDTATRTVAASGSVYLRRSDRGVAGEVIISAIRT